MALKATEERYAKPSRHLCCSFVFPRLSFSDRGTLIQRSFCPSCTYELDGVTNGLSFLFVRPSHLSEMTRTQHNATWAVNGGIISWVSSYQ